LNAYVLDFHGRAKLKSSKNVVFQLNNVKKGLDGAEDNGGQPVDTNVEDENDVLTFGRISHDDFALDFKAPLNAVQAFSVALIMFDSSS